MIVQVELFRSKDVKQIYHRDFEYQGPPYSFNEWEALERELLKNQFGQACFDLGDRISREVLGVEKHGQSVD